MHTLLVEPKDDLDSWLELVTLCRKEGMLFLCENILRRLGAPVSQSLTPRGSKNIEPHPRVMYDTFKFWWAKGERARALTEITQFLPTLSENDKESKMLKVHCLLKRAQWLRGLHKDDMSDELRGEVLGTVKTARDIASNEYEVWHVWAVTNYDQVQLEDSRVEDNCIWGRKHSILGQILIYTFNSFGDTVYVIQLVVV